MKTRQRATPTNATALTHPELGRLTRRRRRRRGARTSVLRPRRPSRVVVPTGRTFPAVGPFLTRASFAPEDFVHSAAPLICELAPMADAELGEEPFPVFPWILADLHGDLE